MLGKEVGGRFVEEVVGVGAVFLRGFGEGLGG